MLFLKFTRRFQPKLIRNQGTLAVASALQQQNTSSSPLKSTNPNDEYTETPEYPEILDLSLEARNERKKQAWYDEIKNIKTIEEKLIKINMPKYYGYKTVALKDCTLPYNCLTLTQHYTRTLFEEIEQLPSMYYEKNTKNVDTFVEYFKTDVQDAIELAAHIFRQNYSDKTLEPNESDKILGELIVNQLNRVLVNSLLADCNHLSEIEVDLYPRHEAFWFVGGVNPSKSAQRMRKAYKWMKDRINEPHDRPVQYIGQPYLALRHKSPLPSINETIDALKSDDHSKVPLFKYDSRVIGYGREYRHGTIIPGFWPGSPHEFGLLSYQKRDHLVNRNPNFGLDDLKEALHAQGIQSSFAWLYAQACYQGFSTFNDVTYPLSTQTIITNGQKFSFYLYQLNTTLMHSKYAYDNPKVNYCWGTKEMKLYEEIDTNGKCIGFNENVLKNLINFYVKEPQKRDGIEMKPYLGKNEQKIADIEDEDRRIFLEKNYKRLTSNCPRHLSIPEIYAWERIYKINNKTRQMEAKRRFFELGINPFQRRLDDHTPEYTPKALVPEGTKRRQRWKKMYYP